MTWYSNVVVVEGFAHAVKMGQPCARRFPTRSARPGLWEERQLVVVVFK